MRSATLSIQKSALSNNLSVIKQQIAPTTKVLAMVKANAYGHGVANVVPSLLDADGFGVATFAEGVEVHQLCQAQGQSKLIVLAEGVFSQDEWQKACKLGFGCFIHNKVQADWAIWHLPPTNSPTRTLWLKYNTGMNRLGFTQDEIPVIAKLLHDKGYQLILTSHFACADDQAHPLNHQQITDFQAMLDHLKHTLDPSIQGSLCNSSGVFNFACAHHDWVRTGIALYGANPIATGTAKDLGLQPVMTLTAKLMAIHHLDQGQSVGYAALWTSATKSRIGVVSIGYGDGYPRVVHGAWVTLLDGKDKYQAPIVGRVAMDMLMVDLTDVPAHLDIGTDVILWGNSPSADEIAMCANTISYELFCRTTNRPLRQLI